VTGFFTILYSVITGDVALGVALDMLFSDDDSQAQTPRISTTEKYINGNVVKGGGDYGDDM
jgi:hypothetical protein